MPSTNILISRRSKEERDKNAVIVINKMIQKYIKEEIEGDLNLSRSKLKHLPHNLKYVRRSLGLEDSKIETIPHNLSVNGFLGLFGCENFKHLPEGLKVKGALNCNHSNLETISQDIEVEGMFLIENTPFIKNFKKNTNNPLEHLKFLYPKVFSWYFENLPIT